MMKGVVGSKGRKIPKTPKAINIKPRVIKTVFFIFCRILGIPIDFQHYSYLFYGLAKQRTSDISFKLAK